MQADLATPERRRMWREKIAKTAAHPAGDQLYACAAGRTSFHCDPFGNLSPCLLATSYACAAAGRPFREVWAGDLAEIRRRTRTETGGSLFGDRRGACVHCPAFNRLETGDEERESDYMRQTTELRYAAALDRRNGETP